MRHPERVSPALAALSALSTLICCLPVGFAAAASLAGIGAVVGVLRPWLLGVSAACLAVGIYQLYGSPRTCRTGSTISLVILWAAVILVALVVLAPQALAAALADWLP